MNINTNQIVSISEANQNFSKVARLVDSTGSVVIFKNNKPKYKLIDLEQNSEIEMTDEEKIDFVAERILKKYHKAFEELAQVKKDGLSSERATKRSRTGVRTTKSSTLPAQ